MRLHEVLTRFSDIIRSYEVVQFEIADLNRRLKLKIIFANGSELHVRDIILDGRQRKYAFHWQEGSGRDLYANVELYAALILHAVDIPSEIFTPTFAIGRTAGWTAHVLEQFADNLLIRPESVYVGPRGRTVASIDRRS